MTCSMESQVREESEPSKHIHGRVHHPSSHSRSPSSSTSNVHVPILLQRNHYLPSRTAYNGTRVSLSWAHRGNSNTHPWLPSPCHHRIGKGRGVHRVWSCAPPVPWWRPRAQTCQHRAWCTYCQDICSWMLSWPWWPFPRQSPVLRPSYPGPCVRIGLLLLLLLLLLLMMMLMQRYVLDNKCESKCKGWLLQNKIQIRFPRNSGEATTTTWWGFYR